MDELQIDFCFPNMVYYHLSIVSPKDAAVNRDRGCLEKTEEIMKPTAILFDLDGTLLPMDQDEFVKAYFKPLAAKLAPHGYDPKALISGIWAGTAAMVKNDGSCTNEEAFWQCFCDIFGEKARNDEPLFDDFYRREFQSAKAVCGFDPRAGAAVKHLKAMGFRLILATNPIFPAVATESRIRWAGLDAEDFEWITTYENSRRCKPNPEYYREILEHCDLTPEACLMVGNDATEDLAAKTLGIPVFLLTDCLINKENVDISAYPHGSFPELTAFVDGL